MVNEIWKDIPGYESKYQVSNLGNIKSLNYNKTNTEKIMKLKKGTDGRYYINLSKNNVVKTFSIHRLVALSFFGECPKGKVVCHKDGNFNNNKLSNLRYDTQTENTIDIYRHERKNGNGKVTINQVVEMRKLYDNKINTQKELQVIFNLSKSQVNKIVNRTCFSYINDDGTIKESKTAVS